ncbi:PDGLE domain-containing protein [Alkalinema sp. FACHB-956]|uniref:PDGLE domain-containing protein n=1 Tax=Alkalinema sp. FACHB-956 TaxID=2692768 RepID=UPI0016856368|nr:PDGLE domain-containing protein [Alkalinema sp. FACHB-956]MBD2326683.1 PDGLE domain-containing protein [Alkalinema sp. FACHB-956]
MQKIQSGLRCGLRSRWFYGVSLGLAVGLATLLSPWASQNPDGLDRVAQDQEFESRAAEHPVAHQLPFYQAFDEYAMRGVPDALATPLAGLVGTLVTFGLTWGVGKWVVAKPETSHKDP